MITFISNESSERVAYENGITLLSNETELNLNLFPENFENKEVPFSYKVNESDEAKNLFDVILIKVNVKHAGSFYANYSKESLNDSRRKELMNNVRELSEIDSSNPDGRKEKILQLLNILSSYSPLFLTVSFTNNKEEVLSFMKERGYSYPVLVKDFVHIEELKFADKEDLLIASEDEEEVTRKEPKEKPNGFLSWLKNNIVIKDLKVNYISYIFALIYPLFIAGVTILTFSFFNQDKVAYAIIMMVFVVVFMIIMFANNNSFFKNRDILKTFKTNYPVFITYLVFSLVGIGLGVLVAYLVNDKFLTSEETPVFSYTLPILVSTLGTVAIIIALYFVSMFYLRSDKSKK